MKKRIICILLTAVMLLTLIPITAFAADNTITNGTPDSDKKTNHGYIFIDKTAAEKDEAVTITVYPEEGYQLKSLMVVPTGFVDLGIKDAEGKPLYWKETNLGASNPQDPGDYYMWGATALMYSAVDYTKTDGAFTFVTENPYGDNYKNTWDASLGFDDNNVPFADGVFNSSSNKNVFTKYTTIDEYAKSGTPDNITTLQPEDDAATAKNANWHTPTYDEFIALRNNCVLVWTSDYNSSGNAGYIVYKAKNDADKGKANMNGTWKMWDAANSKYIANTGSEPTGYSTSDIHIFLPAAGQGDGTKLGNRNVLGSYCSSNLNTSRNDYVGAMVFNKSSFNIIYNNFRDYGFSIRPVMSAEIIPEKQDDVTYQFTMPDYNVVITAEFEIIPPHVHGTGTDAITFDKAWSKTDCLPTESGSYYLTKNITLSGSWTVSNSINLCLNGFNIVREGGNCITINNGGTLSIYDCSDKAHHFDVNSTGLWKLNEDSGSKSLTGGCIMGINPVADQIDGIGIFINGGGTVNMYGGNIVGCKATRDGGGVMVCENATFNMNGGSITGNTAGRLGGGIKCAGTLNLEGGSISNNTASLGGGLDVSGTLNMTNGSIDNNTATDLGGGVNANGTFNMYGGEITNNKATNHSGGVCFNNTAATLGGTAKITNNFVGDTPNNFKLMNGKKVGIGTGDNAPKSGMSIGITMQTPPGQFTTTSATSGDEQYFTSDNNKYKVEYNTSGYLELKTTTIADILATNTDFPTINNTDVPDDAWVNDNGATAHLAKYQNGSSSFVILYQGDGRSINPDVAVTYSNDSYVYTDAGGFIVTFNMENDVLKSITVSNYNENINGTYKPVTYYTVTFDTDGGSKVDAQEIADGKLVTEPTRPTKDGYAFVAWVDANGKTFDFNTPITSDVTIKATWEKNPAPTPNPDPINYKVIEGANSVWVIAAGESPTFRSNAPFEKFSHVLLDGKELAKKYYKAESGSTIITLTPEFTTTLSVGKHTIEIVSTDGSAATVFYIEETIANTEGGFLSEATMSTAFVGMGIVGLSAVFYELKKKKVR